MVAAFLAHSISRAFGGIFEIARRTAQSMVADQDWRIEVFGLRDPFTEKDLSAWRPIEPRVFSSCGPRAYGYAPALASALEHAKPDVTHVHGLWTHTSQAARRWARKQGRLYLISIHGMLEPWALRHSAWKKKLAGFAFQNGALHEAHCLHVNTRAELACVRAYGLRNPVCVIPNGVDLPSRDSEDSPSCDRMVKDGRRVLLYLGRIHPKKGLPNLLQAWAQVRRRGSSLARNWDLAIAGWDQNGHLQELKSQAGDLGIADSVHWLGPLFGEAKNAAFRGASAFVLPSYSEGLPMAGLEAFANRLPVLMTPECNLPEGFSTGSAIRIDPCPAAIAPGLEQLFAMSDAERNAMGTKGQKLVKERFTWRKVAADMNLAYHWVLGGGPPPSFVHFGGGHES
jgi:glycosyltransferase involved in cell wall biosynthesis